MMHYACYSDNAEFLKKLLDKGFILNDQENGGSSALQELLARLEFSIDIFMSGQKKHIDCHESRERIKMIHLLAQNGAKWIPKDRYEINHTRGTFLKLTPDYTVEFIWIMSKYKACSKEHFEQLMKTPTIRSLTFKHQTRIKELISTFETD